MYKISMDKLYWCVLKVLLIAHGESGVALGTGLFIGGLNDMRGVTMK